LKLTVLSGAGMLALAYAAPAHADDQAPPPPLMVAKTAMIAQDEPDATVSVAPETDSAPAPPPESAPVRVVATPGWKLAAKPRVAQHSARPRAHVAVLRAAPVHVISSRPQPVRAIRPHRAVKHARAAAPPAPPRWYQPAPAQYRHADADGNGVAPNPAAATALQPAAPRGAPAQKVRTICELRLRKCLQICSRIAVDNVSQNERWIGTCISSPDLHSALDKLHELLLQRLWAVALHGRGTPSARQYQCFGTQYQSGTCIAARSPAATRTFGWETVGEQTTQSAPVRPAPAVPSRVVQVAVRGRAPVLAAVATHRAPAVNTVVHRPGGTREVSRATEAGDSGNWLLRTLIALVAAAMLALLLAAVSEVPVAGTAVSGMRTRLASKGLSASRIELGRERVAAPPRGRGIPYRD
jgi:hypothetical protein